MSIANYNYPADKNIIELIDKKGLKKKSVAEKAGYSEQMLSDMLNGRKIIRISDLKRLKKALDVSYNDIFAIKKEGD